MPILVTLLALLCALGALPSAAQACRCVPQTPQQALKGAQVVVEAKVLSIDAETRDAGAELSPWLTVRLEVVRSFKGAEQLEYLSVRTANNTAACGYPFERDGGYLVYAQAAKPMLEVSLCSRTRPMAQGAEDLAVLGMGEIPVDPNAPAPAQEKAAEPPARGGCASCGVVVSRGLTPAGALLVLGLAFAVAWRRRGRGR